jgi:large subunit ribosomal protein L35
MPKMKTHRGVAKRYKISGTGKIMHQPAGMSHLRSSKSSRRKRRLKVPDTVKTRYAIKMDRLLPYGVS